MSKSAKFVAVLVCFCVAISSFFVGTFSLKGASINDTVQENEKFRAGLTSIYQKYDGDLSEIDTDNIYALKRIVVCDYDGKDYGAVDKAVDTNNKFAVLQYDSENDAKAAYEKIIADGYTADMDSVVSLDNYDMGEMYPLGSETVGTSTYINNYQMGYDDVTVAVIDTAVMLNHDDLSERFCSDGYDFSSDGFDNADYGGCLEGQYYFHSTFVCGIISNNTPDNVKILPYKVVANKSNDTTVSAIISAINDAVDKGVDVINLSISSPNGANLFKRAIDNALNNGVCVCASAGNTAKEIESYPALIDGTITVSALDSTCSGLSSYSSYGSSVDFSAPGTKIVSTVPTEDGSGYDVKSGTSYSAPYVAAACADIKSINSDFTMQQVYGILRDFAVDYGDEGFDEYFGYGVVNISNIDYTDNKYYDLKIPQGELNVYDSVDYNIKTQPWSLFADKIVKVNIDNNVKSIGSYAFYNMENAVFNMANTYSSIGEYAFYGCKKLSHFDFDIDVSYIGSQAFGDLDNDFVINGYTNTPAQSYAKLQGVNFNSLGCKHNYVMDSVEGDDSQSYTVYTCLACDDFYIGAYVEPDAILSGECGENLTFTLYNTGKLNIDGNGDMFDYSQIPAPWEDYSNSIRTVNISSGVTSVSAFAFYKCYYIHEFYSLSSEYTVIDNSLYNFDGSVLVCAANSNDGVYTMPDCVKSFDATAFLGISNVSIAVNDNFYIESSLIYDNDDNIIMALPSYKSASLTIDNDINVSDYAFIFTDYPNIVRVYSTNVTFGNYSIGYSYDSDFIKNDFEYYGYIDTKSYQYAVDNGFETNQLNKGNCGENVSWYYDTDTKTLTLSGYGDMDKFTSPSLIPWFDYMSSIKNIVIGDNIGYLSSYAFYNANNVENLVLPLSISAPSGSTTWYGCDSIKQIKFTYGTGYMSDYGTNNNSKIYTYTPWYISRGSINSIFIDNDVKYIGAYAFKECSAVKTLTLNDCESIGKYAFYNCGSMVALINYSKQTSYATNCFFNCSSDNSLYFSVYGYDDSTTKDYSQDYACHFVSLGCSHSRGYIGEGERPSCCYDSNIMYYCKDCGEFICEEYVESESLGHYVKATVKTTSGKEISNALVYVDGELAAITNYYGKFVVDGVLCEINHTVEIKKHGFTIASAIVNTNTYNRSGEFVIKYGNFINDNAVNAKDYAYALKNDFDDTALFDYGKIAGEKSAINIAYSKQYNPMATNIYVEKSEAKPNTAIFYVDISWGNEYIIEDCGFVYGKNMDDDMLTLENVGAVNDDGYAVKQKSAPMDSNAVAFSYSSSTSEGKLSARYYIIYSNGVKSYTYYSDVNTYVLS